MKNVIRPIIFSVIENIEQQKFLTTANVSVNWYHKSQGYKASPVWAYILRIG